MNDTVLSVLVLAAIAMVIGAIAWWRRGMRKQAALMLALAAVMAANVAIWLVPVDGAHAPATGELN